MRCSWIKPRAPAVRTLPIQITQRLIADKHIAIFFIAAGARNTWASSTFHLNTRQILLPARFPGYEDEPLTFNTDNVCMNASRSLVSSPACAPLNISRDKGRKAARRSLHAWRLGRLLSMAALFAVTIHAMAADPARAQAAAPHPVSGKWIWTLPGKACLETVHYRADGKRLSTSGDEVTEGDFQITPKPSLFGFYRITETLTQANGKRDCAGDLHVASAESTIRFIQFSPKNDQLIVCKTESLQACYGPLRRAPE
jgi:hypothetical protein